MVVVLFENPDLFCINVDDESWSNLYWIDKENYAFDVQHYFSNDCESASIEEYMTNKKLMKITDALGREVNHTTNQILFHIYDDGSVEKKFIVE